MTKVWLNGRVLPAGDATVPALDRGVLWGYGLFETMRVYDGRVWALAEHLERLSSGAAELDIRVPAADDLGCAIDTVLAANQIEQAGTRITITRGAGPADPHADAVGEPNVIVTAWPLRDYRQVYERGASLVTIPGGGRPLAGLKTTSYAVSVAGRLVAARAGADDALFVCDDGRVLEATGSNVFALNGDTMRTPPLGENLLPGVTRRYVIEIAERVGLRVDESPVTLDDLFAADEVVLTSSLREVYPAVSVDGRVLSRNGAADRLRSAYHAAVLEKLSL
jgi:branched-subunit amino acid aminotransferase/4-amino-4-deoxychorismate lyase